MGAIAAKKPAENLKPAKHAAAKQSAMQLCPASRAVGAEVVGYDIAKPADDAAIAAFRAALADHCFLLFRDQKMTPAQQVDFSRRFGELEHHVLNDYVLKELPEIYVLSNVKESDGRPVGRAGAGQYWHTDLSYMKVPSFGSLLYAIEIPATGGDTIFSNMYKAYDALSEPLKRLFEGMRAVHDFAHTQRTYIAPAGLTKPASAEQLAKTPPVEQPLVRTHPDTGRKSLYVSPGMMTGIVGLMPHESRAIIDLLTEHTTRPEFTYRHQWQVGDLVFWDNWASMHCAVNDYGAGDRRLMHRTTIKGTPVS
ncbi:MAG: TauD/TfdA family dioxygenase [Rhodospirillaceae bacterium]